LIIYFKLKKIKGIILFGSLARGEAIYSEEKVGDIDLIIVFFDKELPEDHRKRTDIKIKLMGLKDLGIDSIWMTESEFKELIQIKRDIILTWKRNPLLFRKRLRRRNH